MVVAMCYKVEENGWSLSKGKNFQLKDEKVWRSDVHHSDYG
jgi:hypothetical protein